MGSTSHDVVNIIVDTIRSSDVECASVRKHLRVLSYFRGRQLPSAQTFS